MSAVAISPCLTVQIKQLLLRTNLGVCAIQLCVLLLIKRGRQMMYSAKSMREREKSPSHRERACNCSACRTVKCFPFLMRETGGRKLFLFLSSLLFSTRRKFLRLDDAQRSFSFALSHTQTHCRRAEREEEYCV
jgi:hypothetical protein